MIKTNFLGHEVPKENEHYICIACIAIDSENGKEKLSPGLCRRTKIKNEKDKNDQLIEVELESESGSELESNIELELKFDTE